MGATAGPSILSLLRNRDFSRLWLALVALFALAIVLGGVGPSVGAERHLFGPECMASAADSASHADHRPDLACCALACFAATLQAAGLPGGDALVLAWLEPLRLAVVAAATGGPPPPVLRRSEPARGPPGAI